MLNPYSILMILNHQTETQFLKQNYMICYKKLNAKSHQVNYKLKVRYCK
ncbi:hypothetical protein SAMN05421877_110147 [Sphingobacterium lactis]|uniref:Uncharacterized protein n=1 Tax=Sphingobacterium lactis TaxID=797291 RepID=A0A1H6BKH0_9SPHI|nr:hypothetical protein SAMN05421877_110147 [Sphingobacterium lactis]